MSPKSRQGVPGQPRTTAGVRSCRLWYFRISAALIIPLLAGIFLELLLRLVGAGYPTSFFLRATIQNKPVWIENARFGWRFFPRGAARAPGAVVLPVRKEPNTCRIFVLGESAAYGDPNPAFGLPRQLAVLLSERCPATRFEVVNAAMTGIDSHVILPIARDCARRDADVWVIYMGNNEAVGPFGAGTVFGRQAPALGLVRATVALKSTRLGQMLEKLLAKAWGTGGTPQSWAGMEMFTENRLSADDPRLRRAYSHFQKNLKDILHVAQRARVKVVLCTVATNLKDCPPFASFTSLTGPEKKLDWQHNFDAGVQAEAAGESQRASACYERAAQVDTQHAETLFRWARCELALGHDSNAASLFARARDHDALRFRADTQINQIIREMADRHASNVTLVDADQLFNRATEHGIAGNELFHEHVHLNFAGNYLLARQVADAVVESQPQLPASAQSGRWLTIEQCADRLALTDWARMETTKILRDRVARLPFTLQVDHAARERAVAQELAELRSKLIPEALAAAAETQRRALAAAPEDWVLLGSLAELLRYAGEPASSAAAAQRLTLLLPHRPEGWLQYGLALGQLGRNAEGEAALNRALQLRTEDVIALCGLGQIRLQQTRFGEALGYFTRAVAAQPKSEEAVLGLARAWEGLGNRDKALAEYRRVLELNPTQPVARSNVLAVVNDRGQLAGEIESLQKAVANHPDDARIRLALGESLFQAGRLAEAAPHFAAALELAPDVSEAHYFMGLELVRRDRLAEAQVHFAKAVELQPSDLASRLNYGVSLARSRRMPEAIAQFEAVLRLQPDNSLARHYLDLARGQSGQSK